MTQWEDLTDNEKTALRKLTKGTSHVRRSIPATTRSLLHASSGKDFRQLWRPRPERVAEQRHNLSPSHGSTSRKADLLWRRSEARKAVDSQHRYSCGRC